MQNCNCSNKCRGSLWKTYMHRLNGGRRFLENRTSLSPSIQAQMSSGDLAHTSLCLESRTTYQWAKQIKKAFIRQGITRTLILYKYSSFCLTTPFLFCPPFPPPNPSCNDSICSSVQTHTPRCKPQQILTRAPISKYFKEVPGTPCYNF